MFYTYKSDFYPDFDMSFQGIAKEECGASFLAEYGSKKYIGNACFFCCVYTALITSNPDDPDLLTLTYANFIQVGGWSKEKTGKMVDTFNDAVQLNKLADHFGVTILVYTELSPNIVYTDAYNRFGSGAKVIHIVKVHKQAHFNLMKWEKSILSMEEVEKAQKKLEKQIKQDRAFALQVEADLRSAAIQEEKDRKYAEEEEKRLKAEQMQIESDMIYAQRVAEGLV